MTSSKSTINTTNNKQLFPISSMVNEVGHLVIGRCNTVELAKNFGTPLYIIDEETFKQNANSYINSFNKHYHNVLVLYAAKAFSCTAIFKLVTNLGLGLDVVSSGELYTALQANVNKEKIYFHGNNKTLEEINMAIDNSIGTIVCDNFHDLELIQKTASKKNKIVNILIRLTPGIECHTHEYIKTGHLDSKFGFDLEQYDDVLEFIKTKGSNLHINGIHAHIGSQIFELKSFTDTVDIVLNQFLYTKEKYNIKLTELNLGGGLGIQYVQEDDPPTIDELANVISETIKIKCKKLNLNPPKLICEPGRSLIGQSGITLYKAGSTKQVPQGRKFVSVDGGMADNPRPITYQAKYTAVVANKMNEKATKLITIAGRYCETGDILIKDILLPKIEENDLIAVLSTGAYNYSMSSNYNMVPRPACILVSEGKAEIIIERETLEDLIAKHKVPNRLL